MGWGGADVECYYKYIETKNCNVVNYGRIKEENLPSLWTREVFLEEETSDLGLQSSESFIGLDLSGRSAT